MPKKTIAIIGAPMDLGAGRRGLDMGPSATGVANLNSRIAGLGYQVEDLGNVFVEQVESLAVGPMRSRYLKQIAETCLRIAEKVEQAVSAGKAPLVLGGDHSLAVGAGSGGGGHYQKQGQRIGVLWGE